MCRKVRGTKYKVRFHAKAQSFLAKAQRHSEYICLNRDLQD